HYIIRTSWVIGDGNNFIRTMTSLAQRGVSPSVVSDQTGRLTFTTTIADAIQHLLTVRPEYGIYNVTNGGEPMTWYEIARRVFEITGHDPDRVTPTTTSEYYAASTGPVAPRPANSLLSLSGLAEIAFEPPEADHALRTYLKG
uniref:SDR family oxidoreductase n=1 Tax=Microbacterium sp. UBA3394 TaxID=1946945 RepID=UPI00257AB7DA